jgi:hypothetical protein
MKRLEQCPIASKRNDKVSALSEVQLSHLLNQACCFLFKNDLDTALQKTFSNISHRHRGICFAGMSNDRDFHGLKDSTRL